MECLKLFLLFLVTLAHALSIPPFPEEGGHLPRDTSSVSISNTIKSGFVSFGDSYAAGIGTGSTTGDGCRIGEFGYPKQLNAWAESQQAGLNFQNLPCSGAIIKDLLTGGENSQIDQWTNPSKADIATVSIGGNDVGFYNVLTSCVLRVEMAAAGNCDHWVNEAYRIMNSADFSEDLQAALHQIVGKSGRSDFKVIQTGYPKFFNEETDSCDYTTFYFWQPGHHGIHRWRWPYLYKSLRIKLNNLVEDLNTKLSDIIYIVNTAYPKQMVGFVDPNPAWEGHRFCEEGITEPDPKNADNWLFLASWPDDSLPGTQSAIFANISITEQEAAGIQSIPDASTCATTHDWANQTLCEIGAAGYAHNSGDKIVFEPTIMAPDGSNISISDIPGYMLGGDGMREQIVMNFSWLQHGTSWLYLQCRLQREEI